MSKSRGMTPHAMQQCEHCHDVSRSAQPFTNHRVAASHWCRPTHLPGTYIAGEPLVTIAAFAPTLHVISSKQRPRKLTIHGGDGAEYMFLLKVPAVKEGDSTQTC